MSLVNFNALDEYANKYKAAKNNIEQNSEIIQKTLREKTQKEAAEVQAAIDKLNAKMESLMQTNEIKSLENEIKESHGQMRDSLKYAYGLFNKIRKIINEKDNLNPQQKLEYEKKLADKIIERFLSKEEMEMFKQMIRYGNIIMIPPGAMQNMIRY